LLLTGGLMKSLQELEDSEIRKYLKEFNEDIDIFDREASYHFCYNYFRNFYENNNVEKIASSSNIEVSCLQLGFYLASWGMFQRKSKLFYKSIIVYEGVIKEISKEQLLWKIDVDNYSKDNIDEILKFSDKLKDLFRECNISATDTLTTKIMMGIFGCVPAFDTYFKKAIKGSALNEKSLIKIKDFYNKNQDIIDSFYGNEDFKTFDAITKGKRFNYKKAKIVDMIGFTLGYNILNEGTEATKE
jgi:hypothetical protein